MLFIKLSRPSESLKTQERLLSQAVSECHLATGVLNVFSQFNHFEWVWVTMGVNASSSLFAVEVTSFVAGRLWRPFDGRLELYIWPCEICFTFTTKYQSAPGLWAAFDEYFMRYPVSYYDRRLACILPPHSHSEEQSITGMIVRVFRMDSSRSNPSVRENKRKSTRDSPEFLGRSFVTSRIYL